MIADVSQADFEARVIERSREVPVVVDFWAEWCAPCRQLGPALEEAIRERGGAIELAKVDVEANQALAQAFGIRGIPDVRAFRDGRIADGFTGARPPAELSAFLDALLPSEADRLAALGDEESLRAALEADPRHLEAALGLARIHLSRGEPDEARALLGAHDGVDFRASGLMARIELEQRLRATVSAAGPSRTGSAPSAESAERAIAAWAEGAVPDALERFQEIIANEKDPETRDLVRRIMVAIFAELGPGDPLASEHRRRLAAALN